MTDNQQKSILIVEDDLFIREIYEYTLKKQGYNILSAEDGEEGLIQSQKKPDLILLDIMMPKLNGIEVLKRLKADENTKNIPVVRITNLGDKNVIEQAFSIGAQGYLLKVRFDPKTIPAEIKKFIDDPAYKMNIDGSF